MITFLPRGLCVLVSTPSMAYAALHAGVTWIQFRNKSLSDRAFSRAAHDIVTQTRMRNAVCIVNDRVHVALAVNAHGVHVGPNDLEANHVRRLVPQNFIVGVSVDTPEEATAAESSGATYLGAGPVYPTSSKDDAGPVLGLDGLRRIVSRVKVPVIAIGGITIENARNALYAGASGVAVLSAFKEAPEKRKWIETISSVMECSS